MDEFQVPPQRPIPQRPQVMEGQEEKNQDSKNKKEALSDQSKSILFGLLGGFALLGGIAILIVMFII